MSARRPWPALLLLCTACLSVGVEKEFPEKRRYALEVGRTEPVGARPDGALAVRRLTVSDAYRSKGFVYRTGKHTFEQDFHHEFFAAPDALLTAEVRGWLAEAGSLGRVVESSSAALPDRVLEGHLVTIHGDYSDPDDPRAVLELSFVLLDVTVAPPAVVAQRTFRESEPLREAGPQRLVAGWNACLERVLAALEALGADS